MIDRTEIELIRILHFENHLSIRQIARMLKRSRNTIERWLKNPEPAPKKLSSNRVFLENHRSEIEDLFLECELNCLPLQRAIKEKFGEVIPILLIFPPAYERISSPAASYASE